MFCICFYWREKCNNGLLLIHTRTHIQTNTRSPRVLALASAQCPCPLLSLARANQIFCSTLCVCMLCVPYGFSLLLAPRLVFMSLALMKLYMRRAMCAICAASLCLSRRRIRRSLEPFNGLLCRKYCLLSGRDFNRNRLNGEGLA